MKLGVKRRYLLFGIAFGMVFPVFSILFDCIYVRGESFGLDKIGAIFSDNPLQYVIATAPIFLGLAFFVAGYFASKQKKTNAELLGQNQKLTGLNESYNTFNYHVSHDLKTIVSNGQSLAMMIRKYAMKNDSQKVIELSEMLFQSCKSGNETIQGFLQLHKISRLKTEASLGHNTAVLPLLEEFQKMYSDTSSFTLHITHRDYDSLPIEESELRSIYSNLLSNSIRYCELAPKITIGFKMANGKKQIEYRDNGIGIDMDKYGHKLFQPFTRITEEKNEGGTGLGLYLVKRILDNYHAEINLKSSLGKGVLITITFQD
jgi:signal transduction histidine kinase